MGMASKKGDSMKTIICLFLFCCFVQLHQGEGRTSLQESEHKDFAPEVHNNLIRKEREAQPGRRENCKKGKGDNCKSKKQNKKTGKSKRRSGKKKRGKASK